MKIHNFSKLSSVKLIQLYYEHQEEIKSLRIMSNANRKIF